MLEPVTASSLCNAVTPNPSSFLIRVFLLKIVEGCVIQVTSTETSGAATVSLSSLQQPP